MKIGFKYLLPSLAIASIMVAGCKQKCASANDTGTQIWLGKTHVIAPTAFTPHNHDGLNDTYRFVQIGQVADDTTQQNLTGIKIKDFRMEVSKGGILIFETYTWGAAWNGKNAKGNKVDGLVDVAYSISDVDGNISEGSFKIFVVPSGECLKECMQGHIFGDMIHPYEGIVNDTKETFCL